MSNNEEIIEGEVREEDISLKEEILLDWAEESWKTTVNTYNEILKLLLNMIILIFSGLIVFFEYIEIYSNNCWYSPFLFLTLAFIASLIGVLPLTRKINLLDVNKIENFRNDTLNRKRNSMVFSVLFLSLSFFMVINLVS